MIEAQGEEELTAVHVDPEMIWSVAFTVVIASKSKLARRDLILNTIAEVSASSAGGGRIDYLCPEDGTFYRV